MARSNTKARTSVDFEDYYWVGKADWQALQEGK